VILALLFLAPHKHVEVVEDFSLSNGFVYSKIGNFCSNIEIVGSGVIYQLARSHQPLIFTRQASQPSLELPLKRSRTIKPATTVDFRYRVVFLVKQSQALLNAIA